MTEIPDNGHPDRLLGKAESSLTKASRRMAATSEPQQYALMGIGFAVLSVAMELREIRKELQTIADRMH